MLLREGETALMRFHFYENDLFTIEINDRNIILNDRILIINNNIINQL